jgi:hypothetical protein
MRLYCGRSPTSKTNKIVESKWELSHLICNWDSTTITNSRFIVVGVIKFRRGQSEKE